MKIITARPDPLSVYLKKVWRFRGLVLTFARRDLKIKYAQTFFGVFWVLLQPLPTVLIFTFLFGMLFHVKTGRLPYPIFALVGMVAWNYFATLTTGAGNALIESQGMLKKIYFPKLIPALSKMLVGGADFLMSFLVILIAMGLFALLPQPTILLFPLFLFLQVLVGLSIGIWISALTFRYRDFSYLAPYIISFSIWLTPVFYPVTILPPKVAFIMYFNPMAFVIEGYRYALGGENPPSLQYLWSLVPVLLLFVSGLWYFRKVENEIADYV